MNTTYYLDNILATKGYAFYRDLLTHLRGTSQKIDRIMRDDIAENKSPQHIAQHLAYEFGYKVASVGLASLVNRHALDGRISSTAQRWAQSIEDSFDADAADRITISASIHMAHLDQIAIAFAGLDPANTIDPDEPAEAVTDGTGSDDLGAAGAAGEATAWSNHDRMKALLKDGQKWVDIDTSYLFNNQYNTADGRRIFDKDISAIRDDARRNMGKCRYCGALIKRGEEEKHFTEMENKGCTGCYWYRERAVDSKTSAEANTTINENGEIVTVQTKTTIETLKRVCTYSGNGRANREGACTLKECRRLGISWFTPENTFFLKYPNGLDDITDFDRLQINGFRRDDALINMPYYKKIGTYSLEALVKYQDGKPSGVYAFRLWNCRKDYIFRYEDGTFLTYEFSFGFSQAKTLRGIPADIISDVKKICECSATAAPRW